MIDTTSLLNSLSFFVFGLCSFGFGGGGVPMFISCTQQKSDT